LCGWKNSPPFALTIESDLNMTFPENLGTVACRCVIEHGEPVLFVSHAGNEWQMYCSDKNHDFDDDVAMNRDLTVVHIAHLLAQDPSLNEVADLPADQGAEREAVGAKWIIFEDVDDQ
jgi:hypothetical protein